MILWSILNVIYYYFVTLLFFTSLKQLLSNILKLEVTHTEVYLRPCQISMMDFLRK